MEALRSAARASALRATELDRRSTATFNSAAEQKNLGEMERGKAMVRDAIEAYKAALSVLMDLMKAEKSLEFLAAYKREADSYLARVQFLQNELAKVEGAPVVATSGARVPAGRVPHAAEILPSGFVETLLATLPEKPSVRWEELAGLESAVDLLKHIVVEPRKFPRLFSPHTAHKPCGTVLLYGPSAADKAGLAKAMATEMDCMLFSLKPSDLAGSESESLLHALFEAAREAACAPSAKYPGQKAGSVVFIDELDSICRKPADGSSEGAPGGGAGAAGGGGGGGGATRSAVLMQMLTELQGSDGVLFVGATTKPWRLDDAAVQRFEKRIHVPLPAAYLAKLARWTAQFGE